MHGQPIHFEHNLNQTGKGCSLRFVGAAKTKTLDKLFEKASWRKQKATKEKRPAQNTTQATHIQLASRTRIREPREKKRK